MDDLIYHSAQPESTQQTYIEYNNVDFVINVGPGRSLVRNSVRINAEIKITTDGTTRPVAAGNGSGVFLDFRIGAHGVIDSCQTVFGNSGLKENIANYARWVEMQALGSLYEDDMCNASNQVELRAPNEQASAFISQGYISNTTNPTDDNMDFSIKPNCILNKMTGSHLPFEKSGEVRLTINLARNMSALMGSNQGSGATYELSNVHCSYHSVPTAGNWQDSATSMRSVYNVKSTILSGSASVAAQVPAVCDAISCSFQSQIRENVNVFNNYQCEQVQGIERVQFLFNDATNKYVTYEISDQQELLHRYVDSFTDTGHNMCSGDAFRTNSGFGIGLHFQGFIDLSNQRFTINLTSAVDNTRPLNMYSYFHSQISV